MEIQTRDPWQRRIERRRSTTELRCPTEQLLFELHCNWAVNLEPNSLLTPNVMTKNTPSRVDFVKIGCTA